MARPRFRQIAHTADVRLAAWGRDEEELLRNAVLGTLACALGRPPRGEPAHWHAVTSWPEDLRGRLVCAANDALFRLYVRGEVAVDVRLGVDRGYLGVAPLPGGWPLAVEVKAATFHDLAIRRGDRLRAVITLDL